MNRIRTMFDVIGLIAVSLLVILLGCVTSAAILLVHHLYRTL